MGIRDRLKAALFQEDMRAMSELVDRLFVAYQEGPYQLPPEELYRQLREQYDPGMIQDLIDQMAWERIGGTYGYDLEAQRQRAVEESRRSWLYSVVQQWIINLWTYYGVGESVDVIPQDDTYADTEDRAAVNVWNEFWTADRNSPVLGNLHDVSRQLLVTGNRFFVFFISDQDGACTIRKVRPEEIAEIHTHEDDDSVPLYYERQRVLKTGGTETLYYPDWRAFFDDDAQLKSVDLATSNGTAAVMLHVPFNQMDENSLYGWPLMAPAGTPWLSSHREFFQNRLAVARAKASYVRRRTVGGGSRAVEAVRSTLMSALQSGGSYETNPMPVAGSEDIHNERISTSELPMGTGAGDAKVDGEMFSWMAGLAGGVFPHYMGLGDAYRLATATAMEKPLQMQWTLYRNHLSAMFRDMARIVLQSYERYNANTSYKTYEVEVSTDRLVETDTEGLVAAIGALYRDVMIPMVAAGSMPTETLVSVTVYVLQTVLQALGATDTDEMVNAEQFEKEEPPAEEPGEPTPTEATEAQPRGAPLPPWPDEPVEITDEDVDDAIAWAQDMDPEIAAMLQAQSDEAENRG